jgi:hypothetical protein
MSRCRGGRGRDRWVPGRRSFDARSTPCREPSFAGNRPYPASIARSTMGTSSHDPQSRTEVRRPGTLSAPRACVEPTHAVALWIPVHWRSPDCWPSPSLPRGARGSRSFGSNTGDGQPSQRGSARCRARKARDARNGSFRPSSARHIHFASRAATPNTESADRPASPDTPTGGRCTRCDLAGIDAASREPHLGEDRSRC